MTEGDRRRAEVAMKLRQREHDQSEPVWLDDDIVDSLVAWRDSPVELRPARRGRWTIRTSSTVGMVRIGEFELRIEPKIDLGGTMNRSAGAERQRIRWDRCKDPAHDSRFYR